MEDESTGGCKSASFEIGKANSGLEVYKHMKHESGVHKVQRVPETEKQGRIHSSTAVILIMPLVPTTFQLNMKEVRIDTYRA